MKKILVPTDFSQQAENALIFAHQVALKTDTTIDLLHVLDAPLGDQYANLDNVSVTGDMGRSGGMDEVYFIKLVEKAREQLTELIQRPEFSNVDIHIKIQTGSPFKRIYEKTKGGQYDVVMMGTAGVSNWEEKLAGSNAERVVRNAHCPVMTIKNKVHIPDIKNIAFASDFKHDHAELVSIIKRLQKFFDAQIHLVKINTPAGFQNDKENYEMIKSFAEKSQLQDFTMNVYNHSNEEEGIICFAESHQMNMIIMATEGRSGLARLLEGSVAEDVVNFSSIPVLTYNEH